MCISLKVIMEKAGVSSLKVILKALKQNVIEDTWIPILC